MISFHAVANTAQEVMSVIAFLNEQQPLREGEVDVVLGTQRVSRVPFTFTALTSYPEIEGRFETWLEEVVVAGLDVWPKRI